MECQPYFFLEKCVISEAAEYDSLKVCIWCRRNEENLILGFSTTEIGTEMLQIFCAVCRQLFVLFGHHETAYQGVVRFTLLAKYYLGDEIKKNEMGKA
jgi:hypothetical protein